MKFAQRIRTGVSPFSSSYKDESNGGTPVPIREANFKGRSSLKLQTVARILRLTVATLIDDLR